MGLDPLSTEVHVEKPSESGSYCRTCGWDYATCDCDEEIDDYADPEGEWEEEIAACCGFFESQEPDAVFVCGAVGSEDCDCCPCYDWLGKTTAQIDAEELP